MDMKKIAIVALIGALPLSSAFATNGYSSNNKSYYSSKSNSKNYVSSKSSSKSSSYKMTGKYATVYYYSNKNSGKSSSKKGYSNKKNYGHGPWSSGVGCGTGSGGHTASSN